MDVFANAVLDRRAGEAVFLSRLAGYELAAGAME
jgi:hypothetical protein